jgi:hypothetical protein
MKLWYYWRIGFKRQSSYATRTISQKKLQTIAKPAISNEALQEAKAKADAKFRFCY